jgi:SpoVK/Ycf46/Vps4 family AAA+-type ATPase
MSTLSADPPVRAPSEARAGSWIERNQAELTRALARLRVLLSAHVARLEGGGENFVAPSNALNGADLALGTLQRLFNLSDFECDLLLLSAGIELTSDLGALCARAQGDATRVYPTFDLALAALPGAHWSALLPSAPLRRWGLVSLNANALLTLAPLRVSESVLHYLTGLYTPDAELEGLLEGVSGSALMASQRDLVAEVLRAWSAGAVLQLVGGERAAARGIAFEVARALGLELAALDAEHLPAPGKGLVAFSRLVERDCALGARALLLEVGALERQGAQARAVTRFAEHTDAPLIVCASERLALARKNLVYDVPRPAASEQREAWQSVLGANSAVREADLERISGQFKLSLETIRAIGQTVRDKAAPTSSDEVARTIWREARVRARARMEDLAQRFESRALWDDLVLPEGQRRVLEDIVGHVSQRLKVYEDWGFARRNNRGLGISALFAGTSGTGKTMAAEVIAGKLELDLYRIDLSTVISKYIGETEKNLRRIFDAAEDGGAILLFDEADAIFGKRSEVKDSHDRYANIEVAYLLQRMESYSGLAILTTNLKNSIDTAFLRRIRFVVEFPFPGHGERSRIWARAFPRETPTQGLDFARLGQLNIAGGNIKNIALNAAFIAASSGQPVGMEHIYRASEAEYSKLEKPLTQSETSGWFEEESP